MHLIIITSLKILCNMTYRLLNCVCVFGPCCQIGDFHAQIYCCIFHRHVFFLLSKGCYIKCKELQFYPQNTSTSTDCVSTFYLYQFNFSIFRSADFESRWTVGRNQKMLPQKKTKQKTSQALSWYKTDLPCRAVTVLPTKPTPCGCLFHIIFI